MRAFASRADCAVSDEPLYAAYLADTGKNHPMRAQILESQPRDWRVVASNLTGPIPQDRAPQDRAHWYQKHMAHHLLPDRLGPWLDELTHVFLVRDPQEMLSSLLRAWPDAELEDTGLPQQVALFERLGGNAPVVDGREVMDDPGGTLQRLCEDIGLDWDPAMLAWPEGPHPDDGVWAEHWYASVWSSTGFQPWRPRAIEIPVGKRHLVGECEALYARLR